MINGVLLRTDTAHTQFSCLKQPRDDNALKVPDRILVATLLHDEERVGVFL
jgi:hypothetical protein